VILAVLASALDLLGRTSPSPRPGLDGEYVVMVVVAVGLVGYLLWALLKPERF